MSTISATVSSGANLPATEKIGGLTIGTSQIMKVSVQCHDGCNPPRVIIQNAAAMVSSVAS
jgi:hypothetical protein